jgi:hypothetical protein
VLFGGSKLESRWASDVANARPAKRVMRGSLARRM